MNRSGLTQSAASSLRHRMSAFHPFLPLEPPEDSIGMGGTGKLVEIHVSQR